MSVNEYPSVDYIRQCLRYEDGKLFWLVRPREHFASDRAWNAWNAKHFGHEAGWVQTYNHYDHKRIVIGVQFKRFFRSVLVWVVIYGKWPVAEIDHKDRNPLNDSIRNLREADRHQQLVNRGKTKRNTTGYKGVTLVNWNDGDDRYRARIKVNGREIHLGCFADPEKAYEAFCEANEKYNKEFACNG